MSFLDDDFRDPAAMDTILPLPSNTQILRTWLLICTFIFSASG